MFGFLKKLGKKSEPVAPLIPVEQAPSPYMPVAVAEPEYASSVATAPAPLTHAARVATPARASVPAAAVQPAQTFQAPRVKPVMTAESNTQFRLRTAPVAPVAPGKTFTAAPVTAPQPPVAPMPAPAPVPTAFASPAAIVELPLKKLWHKLNPTVIQGATSHPNGDAFLRLPLPLLHAQLVKGSVKIPFAEFRGYSPEGLFPASAEKDALEVDLPISEILPLLKPEHLSRRPNQRKVVVPEDIGPIFGPNGGPAGVRIAETKPTKAAKPAEPVTPVAPAASVPPPAPAAAVPIAAPVYAFEPAAEERIAAPNIPPVPAITREPVQPVVAMPVEEAAPIAFTPPPPIQNEPIRAPKLDPSLASLKPKPAQANGVGGLAHAASGIAPLGGVSIAPPAATNGTPKVEAKAPETTTTSGTFTIALMDVAAFWSEKGRNELANLYRHSLDIPMNTLESALKSGRLTFQWREVRPWLRLAPGNTMPTFEDDLQIELPLAIIAPRFIEHRVNGKPKNRVDVGDIPDVFEQKTPPPGFEPAPSAAPVLGATAVPMDFAAVLAPGKSGDTEFLRATAGKPLLEFGEIFGQPEKKNWTWAEVAQKTMGLRGVEGAVIGNSDGLLVAGTWPNGVKGDAVAAFLPQMYGRILQYTKELKLGEPGNVTLMIENVPLQIFKAGTSFFTVIGRAGENLPKAQLNAIAMRLGKNFSGK